MRASPLPWFLLVFLSTCTAPGHSEPDAVAEPVADVGPCSDSAGLYGIAVNELPFDVSAGTQLPITTGFQGFLFVRVGLRAKVTLPAVVKVVVHVAVPGKLNQTFGPTPAYTRAGPGGGSETAEIPFFFNDTPLAELIGQDAHVKVWTTATGCRLLAEGDVRLSAGGYMGADAGFWGDVTQ